MGMRQLSFGQTVWFYEFELEPLPLGRRTNTTNSYFSVFKLIFSANDP